GIVPVHEVGEEEGVHYYSMELVDGITLYDLLEKLKSRIPGRLRFSMVEEADLAEKYPELREPPGRMSAGNRYVRSCVAIAIEVANALAAAHDQRIVHRDLKPSNVMIRDQGRVVLLDFGLARDELAVGLTKTGGDPIGTALYMSPEQAAGAKDLDAQTDIYALGALLYELLALRPPFVAAHDAEVIRRIREEEPSRLRKLNPQVPLELEAIVCKCLAKSREDRYPLVESLELELRAFLAGEKLATRSPNPVARVFSALRRNRRPAGLAAGAVILASLAAGVTILGSRHQSGLEGQAALADASRVLQEADPDLELVKAHYARARALLGDGEELSEARVGQARAAFARHYPQRLSLLESLFAGMSDRERRELADLTEKLAGRGKIRVDLAGRPGVEMHVRAFVDGDFEPEWRELDVEGELPLGEYLLQVIPPDSLPVLRRVVVERDQSSFQLIPVLPRSNAPSGMRPVPSTEGRAGFWIDEEEFSQSRLSRFLRTLPQTLRDELAPDNVRLQDMDLPARGLSFYQARLIAMMLGGHLPSREEYMRAAGAGFALAYPWGKEFAADLLVADPDYLREPKMVSGMTAGASPYGVRQLLGNVAEYLAPEDDRRLFLAGGFFQSVRPDRLRLDRPSDLFEEVIGETRQAWQESPPHAGMRLLRFWSPPDDPAAAEESDEIWEKLRSESIAYLLHEWELSSDGLLDYRLQLRGVHRRARKELSIPFVTQGFLQSGETLLLNGHGREVDFEHRQAWHGEFSELLIPYEREVAPGQAYLLELHSRLQGLSSLQLIGDEYQLRIPVKATGSIPVLHRLRLPRGCQLSAVDMVDEKAFDSYFIDGQQELVWRFMPGQDSSIRSMPLTLRFRRDGLLTSEWPSWKKIEKATKAFFAALESSDTKALESYLHTAYLEQPAGIGRARRLSESRGLGEYSNIRIEDLSAVGPVVSVDLKVDWQIDEDQLDGPTHRGWKLRLQFLREDGVLRVIRMGPRSRPDAGRLSDDGSYRHPDLKLTIATAGEFNLVRSQTELTELQVSSNYPDDPGVRLQVLGHHNDGRHSPEYCELLLQAGGRLPSMGSALGEEASPPIAIERGSAEMNSIGLLFSSENEQFSRERWTFFNRGLRFFLVKVSAPGKTRHEAEQRLAAASDWIDALSRRIVIE
ncbi:MAG: protein kinase domain-containing protein, partial [Planctomycetota bacterium]